MCFEDLPLEIKLMILSYMPHEYLLRIAGVSKSWRDVAYHPALWKTVQLDACNSRKRFADSFSTFILRATLLVELEVRLNNSGDSQKLFSMLPQIPTLRELKIFFKEGTRDRVAAVVVKDALNRFPNVQYLTVHGYCKFRMLSGIPELRRLTFLRLVSKSPKHLVSVLQKCYRLEEISITSMGFRPLTNFPDFNRFYPTLKVLQLYAIFVRGEQLSSLKKCRGLEELELINLMDLSDEQLMILKSFPLLKNLQLEIDGVQVPTKRAVADLFSGPSMKNLRELRSFSIPVDEKCVRRLAQCCTDVERVSLSCGEEQEICKSILVNGCKNLEYLHLDRFSEIFYF